MFRYCKPLWANEMYLQCIPSQNPSPCPLESFLISPILKIHSPFALWYEVILNFPVLWNYSKFAWAKTSFSIPCTYDSFLVSLCLNHSHFPLCFGIILHLHCAMEPFSVTPVLQNHSPLALCFRIIFHFHCAMAPFSISHVLWYHSLLALCFYKIIFHFCCAMAPFSVSPVLRNHSQCPLCFDIILHLLCAFIESFCHLLCYGVILNIQSASETFLKFHVL